MAKTKQRPSTFLNALRRQFFLSYAVIGALMPLLTVFLKSQADFTYLQIGLAMALMNTPMLCSPALITLLADKKVDTRRILAVAFALSACVLTALFFSPQIEITLALLFCHGLSFVAIMPLQDGFYFSLAEEKKRHAEKFPQYPMVRLWGTIGFILPAVILFPILAKNDSPKLILPCAVVFCLLSLVNSFTLPRLKRLDRETDAPKKLPTKKAFAALIAPQTRWLCVSLFFAFLATSIYYAFIANYYTEVVGVANELVGLIFAIGVVLEIFYTLAMLWLQRNIHLKGILVAGLFFMTVRMFLLWAFPGMSTVLLTQIGHGLEVLALFVVPVMFLNRLAGDEFRNSIQGVYAMAVAGVSRVTAGVLGGVLVWKFGLERIFLFTGFFGLVAGSIALFLFSRIPPPTESDRPPPP